MIPYFEFTRVWLGPVPLHVWGFFVALGVVVGMFILQRRLFRHTKDKKQVEQFVNVAFLMLIFGFVGARLGHVLWYSPAFFLQSPLEIFKIWHGGLSSFGGFIGAAVALLYLFKKHRWNRQKLLLLGDSFLFSGVFGWMIARVGCVMIHDHLGKPCNCFLAIGGPDQPRLDMALVEIIALLPLALLFFIQRKRGMSSGWFVAVAFMYYGILRFILDFFRATDIASADARYLGLTPAQYFAMVMAVLGGIVYYKIRHGRIA